VLTDISFLMPAAYTAGSFFPVQARAAQARRRLALPGASASQRCGACGDCGRRFHCRGEGTVPCHYCLQQAVGTEALVARRQRPGRRRCCFATGLSRTGRLRQRPARRTTTTATSRRGAHQRPATSLKQQYAQGAGSTHTLSKALALYGYATGAGSFRALSKARARRRWGSIPATRACGTWRSTSTSACSMRWRPWARWVCRCRQEPLFLWHNDAYCVDCQ